jgi:hypothetical protein
MATGWQRSHVATQKADIAVSKAGWKCEMRIAGIEKPTELTRLEWGITK